MTLNNDILIHHLIEHVKIDKEFYFYNINRSLNYGKMKCYDSKSIFVLLKNCIQENKLSLFEKLFHKFENLDLNIDDSYLFNYVLSNYDLKFFKYKCEKMNIIDKTRIGFINAILNDKLDNVIWYLKNDIHSIKSENNNSHIFDCCIRQCSNNNKSLEYLFENLEFKCNLESLNEFLIRSYPWIINKGNYSIFIYLIEKYPKTLYNIEFFEQLSLYPFYNKYYEFFIFPIISNHPLIRDHDGIKNLLNLTNQI